MPFQKRRTQPLLIDVIRSLQLYLAEGGKLCRVIEAEARLLPFFCAHCRAAQVRPRAATAFSIQHWLDGEVVPEKNVKRIFGAVDRIMQAGQPGLQ